MQPAEVYCPFIHMTPCFDIMHPVQYMPHVVISLKWSDPLWWHLQQALTHVTHVTLWLLPHTHVSPCPSYTPLDSQPQQASRESLLAPPPPTCTSRGPQVPHTAKLARIQVTLQPPTTPIIANHPPAAHSVGPAAAAAAAAAINSCCGVLGMQLSALPTPQHHSNPRHPQPTTMGNDSCCCCCCCCCC
jgi:hypothetical protein